MSMYLEPDRAALALSKYLDTEITPKIDSWWRSGLSDLISVIILRNGAHAIESAAPILKAMKLMNADDKVDMEEISTILNQTMDRQPDGKIHATSLQLSFDKRDVSRLMEVAQSYANSTDTTVKNSSATSTTPSTVG